MPEYLRAYYEKRADGDTSGTMRFVASTEDVARDGMVITADGWQLDNFKRNPVFLFSHDYFNRPPIGKVVNIEAKDKRLLADVEFDPGDEFAQSIKRKYEGGFLSAVSVGFDPQTIEPAVNGNPPRVTKADLLDISAVMVPADPGALKERQKRGYAALVKDLSAILEETDDEPKRAAIPPHSAPKANEDAAWDGPGQVGMCPAEEMPLRRMMAWVDGEGDPDAKQSYKLPHHNADGDVVWRGVAAAMARLLQAGTQIPDSDRRGVYNHLARHYTQFDKEAPEFRSHEELSALGPTELRGLFLEGEPEMFPDLFMERAGAKLSKRSLDLIETAISALNELKQSAGSAEDAQAETERNMRLISQIFTTGA